jgi:hypothetical protein
MTLACSIRGRYRHAASSSSREDLDQQKVLCHRDSASMHARETDLREALEGPHRYEANGIAHLVECPVK